MTDKKNINDFINILKDDPHSYGSTIKEIIKRYNRILLNIPWIGPARKIASALKQGPFSIYYKYERTLSHKLHPQFYNNGLNLITGSRIERQFHKRFSNLENTLPLSLEKPAGKDFESRMKLLKSLRSIIEEMVDQDGHFMVIKCCDYILAKSQPGFSNMLRSIDFKLNSIKSSKNETEKSLVALIKKKYKEFIETFGDNFSEIFIERLKWDKNLGAYAPYLIEGSEETGLARSGSRIISNTVRNYAQKLKGKYIDKKSDTDTEGIAKVIHAIEDSNNKQHGEERGREILHDIMTIWLDDDKIPPAKKGILKDIFTSMFPESTAPGPEAPDQIDELSEMIDQGISKLFDESGNFIEESEEHASGTFDTKEKSDDENRSFEIAEEQPDQELQDFEIAEEQPDQELQDFDIAEEQPDQELQDFDITEKQPDQELQDFDITEKQPDQELQDFDIAEKQPDQELQDFDITEKQPDQELQDFDITEKQPDQELQDPEKNFSELLSSKTESFHEAESSLKNRIDEMIQKTFESSDMQNPDKLQPKKLYQLYNSEIFAEISADHLSELDSDNPNTALFLKIIRYLESGPFKTMTLHEKQDLLDAFIHSYKENEDLVQKLINYKKEMLNTDSLLEEVFKKLNSIEKQYPDPSIHIDQQIRYLEGLLNDENYSVIWKTILNLYRNIVFQKQKNPCDWIKENFSKAPLLKQVNILNYLNNFYRDNKEIRKQINEYMGSEKYSFIVKRIESEKKGSPLPLNKIFAEISDDNANISQVIKQFSQKADETAAEEFNKKTDGLTSLIKQQEWSEKPDTEKLTQLIGSLIEETPQKALVFFEKMLNTPTSDIQLKEIILESYKKSNIEPFPQMALFHEITEAADDEKDALKLIDECKNAMKGDMDPKIFDQKVSFIKKNEVQKKIETELNSLFSETDNSKKIRIISQIQKDPSYPDDLRITAKKMNDNIADGNIDKMITGITTSPVSPMIKIKLLEALTGIAKHKKIISDSPDDPILKKINQKIEFYKRILEGSEERKRTIYNDKNNVLNFIKKKIPFSKIIKDESEDRDKKSTIKSDEKISEESIKDLGPDEKIFQASLGIIKNFQDNIYCLDPIFEKILRLNSAEKAASLKQEIQRIKKLNQSRILKAIEMIDKGKEDDELLETMYSTTPRIQYLWSKKLMENRSVSSIDNLFKPLEKDKKLPDNINRIIRIIKSNNQNDFLEKSITKENSLLVKINDNFNPEKLKKIRSEERGRQDRDKINLFRDLLKIVEENPQNKQLFEAGPVNTEQISEKSTSALPKDDNKVQDYSEALNSNIKGYLTAINSKNPRVKLTAKKHSAFLNRFFRELAKGDKSAEKYITDEYERSIVLFSGIIRTREFSDLPDFKAALKYVLTSKLIKREDLK